MHNGKYRKVNDTLRLVNDNFTNDDYMSGGIVILVERKFPRRLYK